jgi:integrase
MEVLDENVPQRLIVLTALTTGMRIGEIFALAWSDILNEESLIAVRSKLKGGQFLLLNIQPEKRPASVHHGVSADRLPLAFVADVPLILPAEHCRGIRPRPLTRASPARLRHRERRTQPPFPLPQADPFRHPVVADDLPAAQRPH